MVWQAYSDCNNIKDEGLSGNGKKERLRPADFSAVHPGHTVPYSDGDPTPAKATSNGLARCERKEWSHFNLQSFIRLFQQFLYGRGDIPWKHRGREAKLDDGFPRASVRYRGSRRRVEEVWRETSI